MAVKIFLVGIRDKLHGYGLNFDRFLLIVTCVASLFSLYQVYNSNYDGIRRHSIEYADQVKASVFSTELVFNFSNFRDPFVVLDSENERVQSVANRTASNLVDVADNMSFQLIKAFDSFDYCVESGLCDGEYLKYLYCDGEIIDVLTSSIDSVSSFKGRSCGDEGWCGKYMSYENCSWCSQLEVIVNRFKKVKNRSILLCG